MDDRRIDITEVAFIFGRREMTITRWMKKDASFPKRDERGTWSELEVHLWAAKTARKVFNPARG